MGVDYEYQLIFPRDEIWNVLESVAEMTCGQENVRAELVLPDRRLTLPFAFSHPTSPILFESDDQKLYFDTSLFFDSDEAIEEYTARNEASARQHPAFGADWKTPRDEFGRVRVGYIYLSVTPRPQKMLDVAVFSFKSATSKMGLLFTQSSSIRSAFVKLLERHNGLVGQILDSDCKQEAITIYPPDFDREKFRSRYWKSGE